MRAGELVDLRNGLGKAAVAPDRICFEDIALLERVNAEFREGLDRDLLFFRGKLFRWFENGLDAFVNALDFR